jgi:uncharacterized membrane protein
MNPSLLAPSSRPPSGPESAAQPASAQRVAAIDWMRGLVMILMTLDHASHAFNAGRLITDGPTLYDPAQPLPAAQFWVRWITHLCLPMFLFLSGVSLALSTEQRVRRGQPAREIDRHLLGRGALLLALDWLWMSWVWSPREGLMLGVLSAIGLSILAMAGLRRLSSRWLLAVALGGLAATELLCGLFFAMEGPISRFAVGFLFTGRHFHDVHIMFSEPMVPWFPAMLLGWLCQREVLSRPAPWRKLAALALLLLATFWLVRTGNGYGNMRLLRTDGSLVQYLHVSKYPASLTFLTLELGLGLLLLALLLRIEAAMQRRGRPLPDAMAVLGQTSLFYYLVHVHILQLAAWATGRYHSGTLVTTAWATVLAVAGLYPLALGFRALRRRHPRGWLRHL